MNPYEYIRERQILWGRRRNLELKNSVGNDPNPAEREGGKPAYTSSITKNLFESLSPEALQEYEEGSVVFPHFSGQPVRRFSAAFRTQPDSGNLVLSAAAADYRTTRCIRQVLF